MFKAPMFTGNRYRKTSIAVVNLVDSLPTAVKVLLKQGSKDGPAEQALYDITCPHDTITLMQAVAISSLNTDFNTLPKVLTDDLAGRLADSIQQPDDWRYREEDGDICKKLCENKELRKQVMPLYVYLLAAILNTPFEEESKKQDHLDTIELLREMMKPLKVANIKISYVKSFDLTGCMKFANYSVRIPEDIFRKSLEKAPASQLRM